MLAQNSKPTPDPIAITFYRPKSRRHARMRAPVWFVALCLALAGGLVAGQTPTSSQQQRRPRLAGSVPPLPDMASANSSGGEEVSEGDVVRVNTQLITVPVVVRDQQGRPVTGLTASAFELYEDHRPQRVATFATSDAPFEVALLLDTSGSTRAEIALIRRAAYAFLETLRPGDRVAVISFTMTDAGSQKLATVGVQSYLTDDHEALNEALQKIGASNGTPYYDALEYVVKDIFRDPPGSELRGRRALVALTDGVDSTSLSGFASVQAHFLEAGLLAYFVEVGTADYVEDRLLADCQDDRTLRLSRAQLERYRRIFDPGADRADYADFCHLGSFERMAINRSLYKLAHEEMVQLARETGGRTFQATDLDTARSAFAEVAREIGRQYSIGYYSTNNTRDGRFRQIRVEVRGLAGAQVSAREGYQTRQMDPGSVN
jgi:Ca-activated chloride channel homolog